MSDVEYEAQYNLRQYRQMKFALDDFDASRMSFSRLIATLETLLGGLRHADPSWKTAFIKEWQIIHELNIWHEISGKEVCSAEENEQIYSAVEMLQQLVQTAIDSFPNIPR